MWLTQLTAARMQCSIINKKLFYGKVEPLLALEHMAATRSLEELRHIFEETLKTYGEYV